MTSQTSGATPASPFLGAELPPSVTATLEAQGARLDRMSLAVQSDLAPDGQFGEQWLLIDQQDLWVVDRHNGTASVRYRFPLDSIQDAKVERCVGNGLMQVTVGDQPQVLLHYSNELIGRFGRVAHYLHERAEEGPDTLIPIRILIAIDAWSASRLLVDRSSKVCPSCIQRGKILKRLLGLARPFWATMTAVVALMLAGVIVDLLPPYLTRILIDDVLKVEGKPQLLGWLVSGLLAIQVVRVVITISSNWMTTNVSIRFTSSLREQLFAHLRKLPIEYFDKNQIGRLMTRVNQDTAELQGLVSQMTGFALNIMLVVGIGTVLFSMSPSLGLYVLIPTPLVVIAAIFYYRYMRPHFERFWIARWRLNAMLNTFLSGVRVVKAFAQEDEEQSRYQNRNDSVLELAPAG